MITIHTQRSRTPRSRLRPELRHLGGVGGPVHLRHVARPVGRARLLRGRGAPIHLRHVRGPVGRARLHRGGRAPVHRRLHLLHVALNHGAENGQRERQPTAPLDESHDGALNVWRQRCLIQAGSEQEERPSVGVNELVERDDRGAAVELVRVAGGDEDLAEAGHAPTDELVMVLARPDIVQHDEARLALEQLPQLVAALAGVAQSTSASRIVSQVVAQPALEQDNVGLFAHRQPEDAVGEAVSHARVLTDELAQHRLADAAHAVHTENTGGDEDALVRLRPRHAQVLEHRGDGVGPRKVSGREQRNTKRRRWGMLAVVGGPGREATLAWLALADAAAPFGAERPVTRRRPVRSVDLGGLHDARRFGVHDHREINQRGFLRLNRTPNPKQ